MNYVDLEKSISSGKPIELYQFEHKSDGEILQSWYYTSRYEDFQYIAENYKAIPIKRNQIKAGDSSPTLDISVPRDNPIVGLFINGNPAGTVWVKIIRLHEGQEGDPITIFIGRVVSTKLNGSEGGLKVSSIYSTLDRKLPRVIYQPACNNVLYGTGCGAKKENFKTVCTVTGVSGSIIISPELATKPDGYFTYGFIEFNNHKRMIISHTRNIIEIMSGVAGLEIGSSFNVFAGCDRTPQCCKNKFNVLDWYVGFPYIPNKNPFSGGVL